MPTRFMPTRISSRIMLLILVQMFTVFVVAWTKPDLKTDPGSVAVTVFWVVCAALSLGTTAWLIRLSFQVLPGPSDPDVKRTPETDTALFNAFLSFLGVVMLVLVLDTAAVLAGLLKDGYLTVASDGMELSETEIHVARAMLLAISCGLAGLGSVFFTANALYRLRGQESFNVGHFWGGFWFRMGESVLFVLVLFLIMISQPTADDWLIWLPPVSLLMGMFVKSGERLIFGLAERIFEMMKGILPPAAPGAVAKPASPRNLAVKASDNKLRVSWDEPLSAAPVETYRIYADGGDQPVRETHASVRQTELDASQVKKFIEIKAANRAGEGEAAVWRKERG